MNQTGSGLNRPYHRLLKLSWPIMAAMVSQNVMNLVDTAMIGSLGAVSLAGVGLASMAIWVMTAGLQGIGSAVQAITARRLGEHCTSNLHAAMSHACYVMLGLGIPYALFLFWLSEPLFQLLISDPQVRASGSAYLDIRLIGIPIIGLNFAFRGYFNGLQKPKIYMAILIAMHPVNIFLNYVLIFGKWGFPQLGVKGAAYGTLIATTLGCLLFSHQMVKLQGWLLFRTKELSKNLFATLGMLAIPSGFQSLSLAMGYLFFFKIAGMVSTQALAGANILVNLALICILISMGMGLGTLSLVGKSLGSKDKAKARAWVGVSVRLVSLVVGLIGLSFALFPQMLLGIFIQDPVVIQIATIPLVIMGLSQFYDGAAIVLMHAHLGGGAAKTVMVISFVNQWLIFLPMCFIWVTFFNGGLLHLYICLAIYRFLLFLSFYISIRKGKWLSISF